MENSAVILDELTKFRIFSLHIGATMTHSKEDFAPRKLIAVGGWEDKFYISVRMGPNPGGHKHSEYLEHTKWVINVKPLGRISDEDLIQIAKHHYAHEKLQTREMGKLFLENTVTNSTRKTQLWTAIDLDFLRKQGYAMEYGPWSVEQLVEFGIFKLTE